MLESCLEDDLFALKISSHLDLLEHIMMLFNDWEVTPIEILRYISNFFSVIFRKMYTFLSDILIEKGLVVTITEMLEPMRSNSIINVSTAINSTHCIEFRPSGEYPDAYT